jgi:hypothetical protein
MKHPDLKSGEKLVKTDKVVFPRANGRRIVFDLQAIDDDADFNKYFPEPNIPWKTEAGKSPVKDPQSPVYKEAVRTRNEARFNYTVLKTIVGPAGFGWDLVKMDDPTTWHLYEKELKEGGLTEAEIAHLARRCMAVCFIDEEAMEAARETFLAEEEAARAEKAKLEESASQAPAP